MADTQNARSPKDELAADLLREFALEEGKRGIWEKAWEDVAKLVLPYYSTTFFARNYITPGQQRNYDQYDVTANLALYRFGAAMESMLTPASSKWHRLRPADPELAKNRAVMEWFDQANDLLFHYRYSPHANFQAQQHDAYIGLGAFGTSCLFIDEYKDPTRPGVKGLRYRNIHLGELYFNQNFQGQVDTVYRRFRMTLRQIAQRWGVEKLPYDYVGKLDTNPEQEVFVIHIVRPNENFTPGHFSPKGKRFSSYYVLKDTCTLLEEGGYRCFPYAVSRYITAPGEVYGRSPAMTVLPAIRVLNEEKKTVIKQGHRTVDPVLLAHDDGVLEGFSLKPGALNIGGVSAEGRPLVHTLPVGNIAIGKELMDDERQQINDAFLVTLFQILVETPQMTATEVLERAREKGALLSPTMGRYQSEGLGPMIERELDILMFNGLLPPMPPELQAVKGEYRAEYDAPLNRAMRSEEAAGIMRTFQWAAEMAAQTQDASILDWFDTDAILPELADINGAPFRWLRDPDTVAQRRQDRQTDQTAAQVTQALPGMAAIMKATSPQGTNPNSGQPG